MGKFVQVKGSAKGFSIHVFEPDFQAIQTELAEMMRESKGFFKGAKFAGFQGRNLREEEEEQLLSLLERDFDLETIKEEGPEEDEAEAETTAPPARELHVIGRTLRSGQRIDVEGDLVLMGDANPGSILTATGNIVVVGALRGIAHAGINGDEAVSISAFRLEPLQLRIANVIARSTDQGKAEGKREIARLNEDHEISISTN